LNDLRICERHHDLVPRELQRERRRHESVLEVAQHSRRRDSAPRMGRRGVERPGAAGRANGPAAPASPPPKPANWTSAAVQKETDGEIFWKMSNGRGAMPPWKHLPEQERWEIVNYIRTLKGKKPL